MNSFPIPPRELAVSVYTTMKKVLERGLIPVNTKMLELEKENINLKQRIGRHAEHLARIETRVAALERR